ncbi:hypothetical protein E5K79_06080 [Helicobacter pylori]|nr:hypothetical protein E5K79_06080 [Helicobacter pylori]
MFYRFSFRFIVKTHFLKVLFYFLKGIGSTLKSFSLLQSTTKSPKKALSKRLSLNLASSFPLTKKAKRIFHQTSPKNKNLKSGLKNQKKEKDQSSKKKESSKKKSFKNKKIKPPKKEFKKKTSKKL